ncbi:MAG: YfhO family protein [Lachnospiraceae bacterium]|nr:YfhO family protein [Lachnospiraceae bacterium]
MLDVIKAFKNRYPKLAFYITYTFLFFIMFELCYGMYFQIAHKSFMWRTDGLEINYTNFLYFGRWFKKLIRNIFVEHKFVIPMWDMAIGYGSDATLFTRGGYIDPFMILVILFPSKYTEIMFNFVLILKMYFAGIAFCVYARYRGNNTLAVYAGALIYTFSGPVFITFRQWGFISTYIYFPLLMLGIEHIWEDKKPILYIIVLTYFMSAMSYQTYMCCFFIFGYNLIRMLTEHKMYGKKYLLKIFIRLVTSSFVAILYGGLINFAYIKNIAIQDRLNLGYYVPFFYNREYNINIYSGFITGFDGGNDWVIGFSVVALISIFAVLVEKKFLKEKIFVILLTASLFLPFIGHMLNGFKYATNRWIWGYDFLVAYIVVIMSERLRELSNIRKIIVTVITIIYGIVLIFVFRIHDELTILIVVFSVMICIALFVSQHISKKIYNLLCLWVVIISILFPCYYWFSEDKYNLPSVEIDKNTAYDIILESGGKFLLNDISSDALIRYDTQSGSTRNSSFMYGLSGINFYSSNYNNDIDKFNNNIALCTSGAVQTYNGLDKRSTLEYLMGVNYYIFKSGEYIPYGFDSSYNSGISEYYDESYYMYTRSKPASMIYAFDKTISYEDYNNLDAYNKQKALMYSLVVTDEKNSDNLSHNEIIENIGDDEVKYKLGECYGLEYKDNQINIFENQAYMILDMETVNECELYVLIEGLMLNDTDKTFFGIALEYFNNDEKMINKYYNIYTPSYHMYGGRDTFLVNLNGVHSGANKVKIAFNVPGTYRIEDIKIYAESFDDIDAQIKGLDNCSVGDTFADNEIKASIELKKDEYVFISVPYAKGWTAYLDGKETEIYKVDDAFMAIKAPKGIHSLRMEYKTPYVAVPFVLWIIYIGLVITAIVYSIRSKKKADK